MINVDTNSRGTTMSMYTVAEREAEAQAGLRPDFYGEVLAAIGSSAAGTELTRIDTGRPTLAFRVRELELEGRCVDVMEHAGRWWVCASSNAVGPRAIESAYVYPGSSVDGFIAAVTAAAAWDGEGEPDGWDATVSQGRWVREPRRDDAALVRRSVVGDLVVLTSRLAAPHRRSAIGPLVTHETVLRYEDGTEPLMSRRSGDADHLEAHELVVAMARRVASPPAGALAGAAR